MLENGKGNAEDAGSGVWGVNETLGWIATRDEKFVTAECGDGKLEQSRLRLELELAYYADSRIGRPVLGVEWSSDELIAALRDATVTAKGRRYGRGKLAVIPAANWNVLRLKDKRPRAESDDGALVWTDLAFSIAQIQRRWPAPSDESGNSVESPLGHPDEICPFDLRLGWVPLGGALACVRAVVGAEAWQQVKQAVRHQGLPMRGLADGVASDFEPHWLDFLAFSGRDANGEFLRFDRNGATLRRLTVPSIARDVRVNVKRLSELWPSCLDTIGGFDGTIEASVMGADESGEAQAIADPEPKETKYSKYLIDGLKRRNAAERERRAAADAVPTLNIPDAVHAVGPVLFPESWAGYTLPHEKVVLEIGLCHPDFKTVQLRDEERTRQFAYVERWLLRHGLIEEARNGRRHLTAAAMVAAINAEHPIPLIELDPDGIVQIISDISPGPTAMEQGCDGAQSSTDPLGAIPPSVTTDKPMDPDGPGRKPGRGSPKREMCEAAIQLIKTGQYPRTHGRLSQIARALKPRFEDYDLDTIRRYVNPNIREWEGKNPGR